MRGLGVYLCLFSGALHHVSAMPLGPATPGAGLPVHRGWREWVFSPVLLKPFGEDSTISLQGLGVEIPGAPWGQWFLPWCSALRRPPSPLLYCGAFIPVILNLGVAVGCISGIYIMLPNGSKIAITE